MKLVGQVLDSFGVTVVTSFASKLRLGDWWPALDFSTCQCGSVSQIGRKARKERDERTGLTGYKIAYWRPRMPSDWRLGIPPRYRRYVVEALFEERKIEIMAALA